MHVLAVDTATETCLSAVCRVAPDDMAVRVLSGRAPVDARRHGELLAPGIAAVLGEAGLVPGDLDGIVVGLGPGPFTSLRVGVATAAAVADALGIRAVGVCSLDAVAAAGGNADVPDLLVATDARRREVYWARYAHGSRVAGPEVATPQHVLSILTPGTRVAGPGARKYRDVFAVLGSDPVDERAVAPDPVALVRLGLGELLGDPDPAPLRPLYLRRPDAVPLPVKAGAAR